MFVHVSFHTSTALVVVKRGAQCPAARERGLPFDAAARMFDGGRPARMGRWRKDYGEIRIDTPREIEGRIFFAAFTRRGDAIRIISFRSTRETKRYRLRERGSHDED